jgi:cytochrome c oxidase cbb3-type subunit 2
MKDPQKVVEGSIMPPYPWLFKKKADIDTAYAEALTVKLVFNTPYSAEQLPANDLKKAKEIALAEAASIVENIKDPAVKAAYNKGDIPEIVALIAYLNSRK